MDLLDECMRWPPAWTNVRNSWRGLSSDPERSRLAAEAFGIASQRGYGSYRELIESAAQLSADQRPDFITIATPNHTHFEIAQAALEAGFHVVCEKPLTNEFGQALQLARLVEQTGAVFVVAHGYSGYALVRQAREMIAAGELGRIHAVRIAYIQGGLWGLQPGQTPARGLEGGSGQGRSFRHAGRYRHARIPFAAIYDRLDARGRFGDLGQLPPRRPLDDYGHVVLRCPGGELATISVSQVTHGRLNDLTLEVDGSRASFSGVKRIPTDLPCGVTVDRCRSTSETAGPHTMTLYRPLAACRVAIPRAFEALANVYGDGFDAMIRRAPATVPRAGRRSIRTCTMEWKVCILCSCAWPATASRGLGKRGVRGRCVRKPTRNNVPR